MMIIIFIFIYIDCAIAITTCSQNIFEMTAGKKMTNSQNTITKPMSKEDCVALCAKDDSCAAASFNKGSHICELHDQIYSVMDNSPSVLFSRMNGDTLKFDCGALNTNQYKTGINQIFAGECKGLNVYCDLDTDNGRWTVIMRRESGIVSFDHNWLEYENGFGDLETEFWLGNRYIHLLTSQGNVEIRVDIDDFEGQHRYAKYSTFKVSGPEDNYRLTIRGYSGDAGDSFGVSTGHPFTTKDKDNDNWDWNCAYYWGAWWHDQCSDCNLNGVYYQNGSHTSVSGALIWKSFHSFYSMRRAVMMVRSIV